MKYIRPAAASARIKPGPSACQFDALTTTLHASFSRNEVSSVGTNEMGLQSTHVPNVLSEMAHNSYSCFHSHGALHFSMGCQCLLKLSSFAYVNRSLGSI